MLGLPLAFTAPLALIGLAVLPLIYLLLRVTPPRPQLVPFPPLRLILGLAPRQETPARTPWWLMLLRLAIAAAVVLAMAGPVLNPPVTGAGKSGPLVVLLDNGWPAAPDWERRVEAAREKLQAAGRMGRATALVLASDAARPMQLADATTSAQRLNAAKPLPYAPDVTQLLAGLKEFFSAQPQAGLVWIADGANAGGATALAQGIAAMTPGEGVTLIRDAAGAVAIAGADNQPGGLDARVLRLSTATPATGKLRALDLKGLSLGEASFDFAGALEAHAVFDLPSELRNEIARLEVVGGHTAGSVTLLDDRWRRKRVGLIAGTSTDLSQPLLAPAYYVQRALAPFANVREARAGAADPILSLLDENPAVMVLADVGLVAGAASERLTKFVEDGGTLVRFAGPRLAAASDDLVPVRLRRGGRTLGGSLSWDKPKPLAAFERASPFHDLVVPAEVTVTRQVLAEPEPGLADKTWAQLADGTPLITGERRGKGLIVLVHVTADTTWSNLPISGLFVDMMRRIVTLAGPAAVADKAAAGQGDAEAALPPQRSLDGFGVMGPPPVTARPVPANFPGPASAEHPPGFYGTADALLAVNALNAGDAFAPADYAPLHAIAEPLRSAPPADLRPWLIVLAFIGLIADALAALWLAGGLRRNVRRAAAAAALLLAVHAVATLVAPLPASAAETQFTVAPRDKDAALVTRLAYVVTGNAGLDEASRLGLLTLSRVLSQRTSLRPAEPAGIDPARDELAFYPLLYWPIAAEQPQPPPAAIARIADFMKQGGTVIFDTRDALTSRPGAGSSPESRWLKQLLSGVDVPELEPVPNDHVVTRSFYLLSGFPGRTAGGQTWIKALPPPDPSDTAPRAARAGDGVSPIIITSNDLAGAWAMDSNGAPLLPLITAEPRQREMALRGGVNLVMYAFTGNYKADQVHVRELLERLAH